jgi:hypothetical protein
MATKLELAQKAARIEIGANAFFKKNPQIAPLDANVDILSSQILSKDLGPLDSIDSWEKAFAIAGDRLCERPQPRPEPIPEPEVWPHRFMRELRTLQQLKDFPHLEYKALYFDRSKNGTLSEKAKTFRTIVQNILDAENAKRGGSL